MRTCVLADGQDCEGPTNCVCYACGEAVCRACSAIRPYPCYFRGKMRVQRRRLCNRCWEEERYWNTNGGEFPEKAAP